MIFGTLLIMLFLWLTKSSRGPICTGCGTRINSLARQDYMVLNKHNMGITQYFCNNCFQKILDKQGVCPHCNKPLIVGEDNFTQHIVDDKWYHNKCVQRMQYLAQHKTQQQLTIEKTITREVVVKIRCPYCNNLFDETLDKCPYCGGKR